MLLFGMTERGTLVPLGTVENGKELVDKEKLEGYCPYPERECTVDKYDYEACIEADPMFGRQHRPRKY